MSHNTGEGLKYLASVCEPKYESCGRGDETQFHWWTDVLLYVLVPVVGRVCIYGATEPGSRESLVGGR